MTAFYHTLGTATDSICLLTIEIIKSLTNAHKLPAFGVSLLLLTTHEMTTPSLHIKEAVFRAFRVGGGALEGLP